MLFLDSCHKHCAHLLLSRHYISILNFQCFCISFQVYMDFYDCVLHLCTNFTDITWTFKHISMYKMYYFSYYWTLMTSIQFSVSYYLWHYVPCSTLYGLYIVLPCQC